MNKKTQREFMYLFERVGEPMHMGPKGTEKNMTIYNVNMDKLSPEERDAATAIQSRFMSDPNLGGVIKVTQVGMPKKMPNLKEIAELCPKDTMYSYYLPNHQKALREIKKYFMSAENKDEFMRRSVYCRDSPMMNTTLWTSGFSASCLQRKDMKGFKMPAFVEIMPDMFVGPKVLRQSGILASMPSHDRSVIELQENTLTGGNSNLENSLSYWREDIAINSHHWHWHLVFPGLDSDKKIDRRGEMFYYMHHSMIARYNAERLCNGLPRVKPLSLEAPMLEEGYFSKLTSTNSGQIWGTRQEKTILEDVYRDEAEGIGINATLSDIKKYRDRILNAIDSGTFVMANSKSDQNKPIRIVPLTWETGTDILGDIIECSPTFSRNPHYYGSFGLHNLGHVLIAAAHDPKYRHNENFGPMGDTPTAMRDPAFFRWHLFIDNIFDVWKTNPNIHSPYKHSEGDLPLVWNEIVVNDLNVQIKGRNPNILVTERMQSDVDLSRGIDYGRRDANNLGPIWVRYTHLNYEPFDYNIKVSNNNGEIVKGTVRIFMAPRNDEEGKRFMLNFQRKLFFEMDKFVVDLKPGENTIRRSSLKSSVAIPWSQTFRDLEREMEVPDADKSYCGCGWPQHMLLPKGKIEGMPFDLFVMVTDADIDIPKGSRLTKEEATCHQGVSYCGILDEVYPDTKPMGYPFDRDVEIEAKYIENFMPKKSNGFTKMVIIVHINTVSIRDGGAPAEMNIIKMDPHNNTKVTPVQKPGQNRTNNNQNKGSHQSTNNSTINFNNGQSNSTINFNNPQRGYRPQQTGLNVYNSWSRPGRSPSPVDWAFEGDNDDENDHPEYWHF